MGRGVPSKPPVHSNVRANPTAGFNENRKPGKQTVRLPHDKRAVNPSVLGKKTGRGVPTAAKDSC